ncbi:unnamed protein product [Thelazia callipaeda]|uniref:Uncharacterized protein n=1 Tax=Thelazia callipaeda TaxID=103827 RepID=A0A0N5CNP7_THECL|nr:unnamed protein product [Thelazia callipaeda]
MQSINSLRLVLELIPSISGRNSGQIVAPPANTLSTCNQKSFSRQTGPNSKRTSNEQRHMVPSVVQTQKKYQTKACAHIRFICIGQMPSRLTIAFSDQLQVVTGGEPYALRLDISCELVSGRYRSIKGTFIPSCHVANIVDTKGLCLKQLGNLNRIESFCLPWKNVSRCHLHDVRGSLS